MSGATAPASPTGTPTGMHDVLWPESARWEDTVARFATLAEAAGYGLALTPVLEHVGVFHRGIGEGSEVVGKEMYTFEDRDGQVLALRPEGTAPVARAFVQHHPVPPWKVWYVAPSFRHERPQHGRYRQHHQLGVEALGPADPDLDVEVVVLAHDFFDGLGLRDVTLKLHSMGDRVCRPGYVELLGAYLPNGPISSVRPTAPVTWRTPCGCWTASPRSAAPRRRTPPACSTTSVTTAGHTSSACGPDSTPSAWRTRSIIASCGASTTTPAPRSSSPRALDAAQNGIGGGGRYDGLVEMLGAPRHRASDSASGWSACCSPATPRAFSRRRTRRRGAACTPT